jgi:hypothetical protein
VINDVVWLTTSMNVPTRGFNTVEVDVGNCSVISIRNFDTYASTDNSDALANYVFGLSATTTLVGVTADEASTSLTDQARAALLALGVNVTLLAYRGKVAFVAQVGRSSATAMELVPPFGNHAKLKVVVSRT